jgi:glycosyltransferase involved in cell wall biosynthesis
MLYLSFFILAFTLLQLLIALANILSRTHLPYTGKLHGKKVSILIPARNEEKNIGNILSDIKKHHSGNTEVIIFDDQSEDRTVKVVNEFVRTDKRFRLVSSSNLPEGWLGKNHACHSLAKIATGDYFIFLDADVRISGNLIGDSISFIERSGSDLVSIFPKQVIVTPGEWATVPNMNYILVSLLPLVLVRNTGFSSLAAANGQFMMFSAEAYRDVMPHEKMKNEKVEDILIARYFKNNKKRVSCMLGDERISCRMYSGFNDAVNGFSKNVAEFFGGSYLVATLFWIITTFGFIAVLFTPQLLPYYLAMYLLTRIAVAYSGRQSIIKNLLYIVPLQLSMGLFILKSFQNMLQRKSTWKGRNIHL